MVLKKIFLISFLLLSFQNITNAQFGIKAGVNLSYINGADDLVSNRSSSIGFGGGFMYKIPVKDDWLFVQPELIYIQKGGMFDINLLKIDAKLEYIELPVLVMYNILGGVLNLHAGPQFSLLRKVKYSGSDDNNQNLSFEDKELDNYNTFDLGLVLGVGVELEIIVIEVRYSIGFMGVEKGFEYDGQQYNPNSKNFNAQLLIGYFF